MKLNLTSFHFRELIVKGYSLDHIFLLKMIHEQLDLLPLMTESVKITALVQSLVRKGLITEAGDKLTTMGTELLVFMDTKDPGKIVKKKVDISIFEEWWKAFPGTDTFSYKGKTFSGSRSMRVSKDDCRIKFDKILLEGEYTAQDLIDALKFDVLQKKEASVYQGKNKLTYMQNSLTYLNQRSYEPFIELIKEGSITTESTYVTGTTDI